MLLDRLRILFIFDFLCCEALKFLLHDFVVAGTISIVFDALLIKRVHSCFVLHVA